ncbi:hypothetical protein [Roseomonas sp. BN140053]|uniref:hypothetical protein n=1 Tax=Roseomonas sp. BN140053 TaxID=3391898 RepID=UPI0039E97909
MPSEIQPIPADSLVSLGEVCVALNLDAETLEGLAMGPFSPAEPGWLTVRSVVGIYLVGLLTNAELMSLGHVVTIAAEAAKGATDGGARSLLVAWKGRKPVVQWVSPADLAATTDPIRIPILTLPVDQMLEDLGCDLSALRRTHALAKVH